MDGVAVSIRGRWRKWRRKRRLGRSASTTSELLREFVYLDEVSVYSLTASKDGMIAAEVTDAEAMTLDAESTGALGASAGVARAQAQSSLRSSESRSTQVLKKAIVQSTFRDLHLRTRDALAIGPNASGSLPNIHTIEDLAATADQGWIIDPATLTRGDLVEMNVILRPEPLFEVRAVMSAMFEMLADQVPGFGEMDLVSLGQAAAGSIMLDKLLVGLVPLHCMVVDYVLFTDEAGKRWILHKQIVSKLRLLDVVPLSLVGVAEQTMFWRDVRRVLFSDSKYTVFGRLSRDGLQASWTPLKLVELISRVNPDLERSVDELNRTIVGQLADAQGSPAVVNDETIWRFAELLMGEVGQRIPRDEFDRRGLLTVSGSGAPNQIDEWRSALDPVTRYIETVSGKTVDRAVASDCRVRALGLISDTGKSGRQLPAWDSREGDEVIEPQAHHLLESEIIAIYW